MPPDERPEVPDRPDEEEEETPVGVNMRFTVIDRLDGWVHLLSEGGDVLFAHPAVSDQVWDAALDEVPDAWEIVDLPEPIADVVPRARHPSLGVGEPGADGRDADELAECQFALLTSFVRAGFDRAEAMALVLELLRCEGPDL